jgi:hypothetical protein
LGFSNFDLSKTLVFEHAQKSEISDIFIKFFVFRASESLEKPSKKLFILIQPHKLTITTSNPTVVL